MPVIINGKPQMRCPARPMLDDPASYGYILNTLSHYRNGFLPYAGGIQDQPFLLMQYVIIAHDQASKCEAQKAENASSGKNLPRAGRPANAPHR